MYKESAFRNNVLKILFLINTSAAVLIIGFQEYLRFWPHDAINYILSGAHILNPELTLTNMRANLWSIFAGLIALVHPYWVRVFGIILFFLSIREIYLYLQRTNTSTTSKWFVVFATLPTYTLWVIGSGLSEPLAYFFVVLSIIYWFKYLDTQEKKEKYILLSATFASLAFCVRAPLILVWAIPAIYLLLKKRPRVLIKSTLCGLLIIVLYGILTSLLFGTFLPSQKGMLFVIPSVHNFNASAIWYAVAITYPLVVFGFMGIPILFHGYLKFLKKGDPFLQRFIITLMPYYLAMIVLAPKEPRYYTLFLYPAAYTLAKMVTEFRTNMISRKNRIILVFYVVLFVSSFLISPGVSMHVEYIPQRQWVVDFPSLVPPYINDAIHKTEFIKDACGGQKWEFIHEFYWVFYNEDYCELK